MSNLIGGHTEEHLLECASRAVAKSTAYSHVLDETAERRVPTFKETELDVGRVLGRGGFCVVSEVQKIQIAENSTALRLSISNGEDVAQSFVQNKEFMAANYIRQGKDFRYAIKRVQESSRKDPHLFVNAVVDLAVEARFLSVVRHPSIIKMRAMSREPSTSSGFFLVLDKLYDILSSRLLEWNRAKFTGLKKLCDCGGKNERAFWAERCLVAFDLCKAIHYLHSQGIVYRDLKPENIGFDVRGDVKVFDFGLAKELDPGSKLADGTYKLTAETGSPRYMAPEVALGKPYNETVDVYAFCVLLWEILALNSRPFEGYTMNMLRSKVYKRGSRPKIPPEWPQPLKENITAGWGADVTRRPSMAMLGPILRAELESASEGELGGTVGVSHKSQLSLDLRTSHKTQKSMELWSSLDRSTHAVGRI